MNHLEHFYLCISIPLDIIDNQDDVWEKWGNGDLNKIFKLSKKYDKLQSDKNFVLE
ncbi:13558_t:CDS:2 [Ambispora leptoticha]|uniref:13558_t:CDS:1 n=1 Tax=Ambispora leptoticha TaxID=144679 RepID=A0A9N9BPE4_9GLOM|nr:13558_t:CDS:2 [Ambispora leptoticha]